MDYEKKYNEALERARQIKDGKEEWRYSDLTEITPALTEIFPELAESEDERIRKWLIHEIEAIYVTDGIVKNENADKALAWLEKQKEPKEIPLMNGDIDLYFDEWNQQNQNPTKRQCFEEGIRYAQRLQKEHQDKTDAPEEKSVGGDFLSSHKDKNLDEIAQDYVDNVKEYNPEPTWDLMQTAVCYGYHYREGEEQKLVEWSEEEKDKLNSIERLIVNANAHGNYLIGDKEAIDLQHFIRSIVKPTTNLAEWNKEDEKMLEDTILIVKKRDNAYGQDTSRKQDWLKDLPHRFNLQPKQEWSEEDKAIVGCIARCLDGQFVPEAARKQALEWFNKHRRDFLNSTSWKPSEVQMTALDGCLEHWSGNKYQKEILESLYEQLKKLT